MPVIDRHYSSPDDSSTASVASVASPESAHIALDELSDTNFLAAIGNLQTEMRRLEIENQVFENFLLANEPTLIAAMNKTLESAQRMKSMKYRALTEQVSESSDQSEPLSTFKGFGRPSPSIDMSFRPNKIGPRINFSQKTDLVLREIEEMQVSLEKFIKKSRKTKFILKAEIEESAIRDLEVKEAREVFEQNIVIDAVDKLTQKIPAEKFVRYMQEWLKSAQFILEKLRLRTSSIKIQHSKLKILLAQKEEISESVHEVDFERLRIENKHLLLKIEQKNNHLLELKRMNGKANLLLTTHKKILKQQGDSMKNIKVAVLNSLKHITELGIEAETAEQEVETEREKLHQLKQLVQKYKVPDVMEYINKKCELEELRKDLKTWKRKCNIQKTAVQTCTWNMKNKTGFSKSRPSWFEYRSTSEINEDGSNYSDDSVNVN